MTVTGIITAIIVGLVIGALGRLVVPGKQNIPIWLTIVIGIVAVGRSWNPSQHRRIHPHHRRCHREGRRRGARQGDHHPQPRRAADDYARHGLHFVGRSR